MTRADHQEEIARLRRLHGQAERELAGLARLRYLTPNEQARMRVLKKCKLHCKDCIVRLRLLGARQARAAGGREKAA